MQYPGFIDGSYLLSSVMAGVERSINVYPEVDESGHGKNKIILQGTPGLVLNCDLATGKPVRMVDYTIYTYGGNFYFYAISDTGLFQINVLTGAFTHVGTVANDGDLPAYFYRTIVPATNGTLLICGGHAYSCTNLDSATPTLTDLTGVGGALYGNNIYAANGAYLDGYFLVCDSAGGAVYYSSLNDASTWDLLNFFQPLGGVNRIQNCFGELWCQSLVATEVFYNSGNATIPFTRIPGSRNNQGALYPESWQYIYNSLIWVGLEETTAGGGGIVYQATNYVPVRISNHNVEESLSAFSQTNEWGVPGAVNAFTYTEKGHSFYVLRLGTLATWVYDCSTTRWHERAYSADAGVTLKSHLARCHSHLNATHFVGSRVDGKVYKMNDAYYDDAGTSIFRMRQAPHLTDEARIFTYHNFQLDMETGLDLTGPPPTEVMNLAWSNDGGHTFTAPLPALIGKSNAGAAYRTRVLWRRLGSARDRVFQVSTVAPIRHTWTDAFLNNLTD